MARYHDLDDQFNGLNIDDEENVAFVFGGNVEAEVNRYELCVVGRFMTERNININAMKTKMADVWRPTMGINIKELEPGVFLFQFYHKEDMQWVLKGGPWSFDNAMLVMAEIPIGDEPLDVPLWYVNMWMQIYDIPSGLMSEAVGKQLGDFFGKFLEYDTKNNASIWREFMRIRVKLDVRKPLKRSFLNEGSSKDCGSWLRALSRRAGGQARSRWLRVENDTDWEARQERYSSCPKSGGFSYGKKDNNMILGNAIMQDMRNKGDNAYPVISAVKQIEEIRENSNLSNDNGLEQEEMSRLQVSDRKRMRGGPKEYDTMDTPGGLVNVSTSGLIITQNDDGLSEMDCATLNNSQLAKLAQQASRTL
ncbi:hypothetical protein AgCh_021509 [Apium graveolens]